MKTLMAVFLVLIFTSIADAKCLRCGSSLICTGETGFDLNNKCGKPDHSDQTTTTSKRSGGYSQSYIVEEKIERLYYNCGEGQFIQIFTIKGGKIDSITEGNRGNGPVKCQ